MSRRATAALLAAALVASATPVLGLPRSLDPIGPAAKPDLSGARYVAVSPDGAHVYVSGTQFAGVVDVFVRDPGTGRLTFASLTASRAGSLAVSPEGAHVYVVGTGGGGSGIDAYARNSVTGALAFIEQHTDGVGGVDGLAGASDVQLSPDGAHVYVVGAIDDAVAVFARTAGTGALTFVEMQQDGVAGVDGLESAGALTVSPDGAHVYATGAGEDAVAVFARNAGTGALTFVEMQQDGVAGVDGIDLPRDVVVSADGAHVYVTGQNDSAVAVFARNAGTGTLTFVEVQRDGVAGADGLAQALSVTASADGSFVYVTANEATVATYARNPGTGALTFVEVDRSGVDGVAGLVGDSGITLTPDGAHLYTAANGDDAVVAFARNAGTGALTIVDALTDLRAVDGLAVSPDGAHVYAPVTVSSSVAVFGRDGSTGALRLLADTHDGVGTVTGLRGARAAVVSPDGAYVYVLATSGLADPGFLQGDEAVTVFARDAGTGRLTFVEEETSSALTFARSMALAPDGGHLYVANPTGDAIVVLGRDALTGHVTLLDVVQDGVAGADGLQGVTTVAVSPDGANVYAAGTSEDAVAVLARNAGTGLLTPVEVQRDGVGGVTDLTFPKRVLGSPDGAHVYVGAAQALGVFSRNPGTGALAFVQSIREGDGGVSQVLDVGALAFDPAGELLYASAFFATHVTVLGRNPATGMLRFVEAQPAEMGQFSAETLAVSPDGSHVYQGPRPTAFARDFAGCESGPRPLCRGSSTGKLRLATRGPSLTWRWLRGDETALAAFGDPTADTDYALCVYDESGPPTLVLRALVPAGGVCEPATPGQVCWRPRGPGFRYRDKFRTPEGLRFALLRAGGAGQARVVVTGSGATLDLPPLPLTPPLRVQLEADTGECWEATYSTPLANTATFFSARPD